MKKIYVLLGIAAMGFSGIVSAQCSTANLSAWSVVNNTPVSENGFGTSLDVRSNWRRF